MLLGASNLTRAFPMVVRLALNTCNGPLSIHTAMGFGRSYGKESRFLLKKSLGIFQSKIWDALAQQKSFPTTAFMTDIGNDLAYEVPVDQLMEWVEDGVVRLQHLDAKNCHHGRPFGGFASCWRGSISHHSHAFVSPMST